MEAEKPDSVQSRIPLEQLHTLDGYRRHFMDASCWESHVRAVYERHMRIPCQSIRPGLPGTYPTFIVDDRWVVKFFGRLFDGALAFETELEVGRLLSPGHPIPSPAIVASGYLFEGSAGWPWPYLIFEFISGVSIGEVYERVSYPDRLTLAQSLGEITRRLHEIPTTDTTLFQPTWDAYARLLEDQRARCRTTHLEWNTLPDHLTEQIDAFLLPLDVLVDRSVTPHLIHADLTRDHILGRLEHGHWTTLSIIDFGDAMIGDTLYELIALHLDLFRCNKRLLSAYLDAYNLDAQHRHMLPAKAMSLALLHRFNVLVSVFESYPHAREVSTLDQLATLLWDVGTPGLED
jgi:hygromycin-B 7''-O-kinase